MNVNLLRRKNAGKTGGEREEGVLYIFTNRYCESAGITGFCFEKFYTWNMPLEFVMKLPTYADLILQS